MPQQRPGRSGPTPPGGAAASADRVYGSSGRAMTNAADPVQSQRPYRTSYNYIRLTVSISLMTLHPCGTGSCNGGVSVRPFICLSVCPVDRKQQQRAVGLLLSTPPAPRTR